MKGAHVDENMNGRQAAANLALIEAKIRADLRSKANAEKVRARREAAQPPARTSVRSVGLTFQEVFKKTWECRRHPETALPAFEPKHWGQLKHALKVYQPGHLGFAIVYMILEWEKRRWKSDPLVPNYDVFFARLGQWCSESMLAAAQTGLSTKPTAPPAGEEPY
jgi:hypothetical protein